MSKTIHGPAMRMRYRIRIPLTEWEGPTPAMGMRGKLVIARGAYVVGEGSPLVVSNAIVIRAEITQVTDLDIALEWNDGDMQAYQEGKDE